MTRNTKIALGCGGAGCLGLILLVIVCAVLIVTGVVKAPGIYSPSSNSNYNSNYNYNSNSNANHNLNSNSGSSPSSSMSDDDKHKLLQAAGMANDTELLQKVLRRLGFITDTGVSDDYAQFIKDHATWGARNLAFVNSMRKPGAARAYVDAHIDD
jgi:hypothetical protein